MSREHPDQPLAAYVLGALPPDERIDLEAHVAACPDCAAEISSLQRVADALARAVPLRTPRPDLRARVLASVAHAGFERGVERAPAVLAVSEGRSAWSHASVWLPVAALLLLVVGLGAHAVRLQNRVAVLESRLDAALAQSVTAQRAMAEAQRVAYDARSAMGVLAAPDLARIDLAGQTAAPAASARALWSRQRGMVFTASNLPALPPGRVYQVWVVTAQGPVSAGLLEPDTTGNSLRVFSTPANIAPPVAVAVTLEPAGGVPAPTGEKFLVGTPAPAL